MSGRDAPVSTLAPPRLSARIESALAEYVGTSRAPSPDDYVGAALQLLDELVSRATAGRESALDLLTVDALMTYAFERAATAGDASALGALAERAMQRTSALAGAPDGSRC